MSSSSICREETLQSEIFGLSVAVLCPVVGYFKLSLDDFS